jgi:hypothetical protein
MSLLRKQESRCLDSRFRGNDILEVRWNTNLRLGYTPLFLWYYMPYVIAVECRK